MRRALWILLLVVLLGAAASAQATGGIVVDGVRYEHGQWGTQIVGYEGQRETVTVRTNLEGRPVQWDMSTGVVGAKAVVFAPGGSALPSIGWQRWPNLERMELPDTLRAFNPSELSGVPPTLAAIAVHPDNPAFCDVDGVVYSRDMRTLVAVPPGWGEVLRLPDSVEAIMPGAFLGDEESSLRTLALPGAFDRALIDALPRSGPLAEIALAEADGDYVLVDGMLVDAQTRALLYVPPGRGGSLVVPATVATIDAGVFGGRGNEWLRSVSLPVGMQALPPNAFAGCTALESVALPLALTEIPQGAFAECIALRRAVLPAGVAHIGALAFNGCTMLEAVYLPGGLQYMDPTALDEAREDVVVYAAEGTEGQAYARAQGLLWAVPGGVPVRQPVQRYPVAVVDMPLLADVAALRAQPDHGSQELAQYPNGTLVEVLAEAGDWRRVRVGPEAGYLPAQSLMDMDPLTQLIAYKFAQLQNDPFDESDPYNPLNDWPHTYTYPWIHAPRTMSYDRPEVPVLDAVGPWVRIDSSRQNTGYMPVSRANLFCEEDGSGRRYAVVATPELVDRALLYAQPNLGAEVLGHYYTGTQVELQATDGTWARVDLLGQVGYMEMDCIKEVPPGKFWWEYDEDPNG